MRTLSSDDGNKLDFRRSLGSGFPPRERERGLISRTAAGNRANEHVISYPDSSGFWSAGGRQERLKRIRKKLISLIGCSVTACVVLPQKSCGNKKSLLATNRWPKSLRTLGTRLTKTSLENITNNNNKLYYQNLFVLLRDYFNSFNFYRNGELHRTREDEGTFILSCQEPIGRSGIQF